MIPTPSVVLLDGRVDGNRDLLAGPVVARLRIEGKGPAPARDVIEEGLHEGIVHLRSAIGIPDVPDMVDEETVGKVPFLFQGHHRRSEPPLIPAEEVVGIRSGGNENGRSRSQDPASFGGCNW